MCMIDDADYCSVYRSKDIKAARKEHKCTECGRVIRIGESYLYTFLVYDGVAEHYDVCQHCHVATDWLNRNCHGFLFHGVYEDIAQHTEGVFALGLRRLLYGMSRQWKRRGILMPLPKAPSAVLD